MTLRKWREKYGFSQTQAAVVLGTTNVTVSNYERGVYREPVEVAHMRCSAGMLIDEPALHARLMMHGYGPLWSRIEVARGMNTTPGRRPREQN